MDCNINNFSGNPDESFKPNDVINGNVDLLVVEGDKWTRVELMNSSDMVEDGEQATEDCFTATCFSTDPSNFMVVRHDDK